MKFGTKTLPLVLQVEERNRKVYVERPIPGKAIPHRKIHGSLGEEYVVRGLITSDLVTERAALKALADGTPRILDLEDGTPQLYAMMVDPVFQRPEKPGQIPYELLFAQTAILESRTLSDTPSISEVLNGLPTRLSFLNDFPSISELLKHYRGQAEEYGFSTIGSQNYPFTEEGMTGLGTQTGIGTDNTWFTKITIANPCTVKAIHIYMAAVVGNKRLALYDNAQPNNLLGQTDVFVGSGGAWAEINLTSPAHVAAGGTFWLGVSEIDGNSEQYHCTTAVSGDGYATTASYVTGGFPSTVDIDALTVKSIKIHKHTSAVKIKGYIKATKFTLAAQKTVDKIRFYSHVAAGNVRVAIYDNASPKALKVESSSVAVAVGWNEIDVTDTVLAAGTYWLVWQYDSVSDVPSYAAGASGDGFYKAQAYGAFPATISGETSSAEKWTETMKTTIVWTEI